MLQLIDAVSDDEWGNGGMVFGSPMTVGGAFNFPNEHIAEHSAEMRRD